MLEFLVNEAAEQDVEQIVLGMAHRGRLNVLANLVGKPYEMILAEFEGSLLPDWVQGDGDVKYHQGILGTIAAATDASSMSLSRQTPATSKPSTPSWRGRSAPSKTYWATRNDVASFRFSSMGMRPSSDRE